MDIASRTNGEGKRRALLTGGVGYGVVCGLTFPLMISNTFLKEMSLSHGAGDSFGALFFLAYSTAMLGLALRCLIVRKPCSCRIVIVALAAVFLGNTLMLLRHLSFIEGGWPYAIAASVSIGVGLATAEVGWMERLVALGKDDAAALPRMISLAYLFGGAATAFIFFANGPAELSFALLATVASAVLFARTPANKNVARPSSTSDQVSLVKAISYLAVFSFVFGAVSQMVELTASGVISIELQAIVSIVAAAGIFLTATFLRKRAIPVADLYGILFPLVAAALIALPFITSPWVHGIASILVFVAFYLSGMNVRIIVCQLSRGSSQLLWVYLGCALGVGGLLVIAGVVFGATVLAQGNPATALALVSLISLFILAMNPVLANRIERRTSVGQDAERHTGSDATREADLNALGHTEPGAKHTVQDFAHEHGLTAREGEVLALLCQGRTRTYIADELGLSPNTVKGYIRTVYQKSGAVDKQDLLDRVELFRDRP